MRLKRTISSIMSLKTVESTRPVRVLLITGTGLRGTVIVGGDVRERRPFLTEPLSYLRHCHEKGDFTV